MLMNMGPRQYNVVDGVVTRALAMILIHSGVTAAHQHMEHLKLLRSLNSNVQFSVGSRIYR